MKIAIDRIDRNPDQPRTRFNQAKLEELAESIKQNGLMQPITVRWSRVGSSGRAPALSRYVIVAGERRWRAHQIAGLAEIECNVQEMTDDQQAINAIVENLQREDIGPLEEARAFQRAIDQGYTPASLAQRLGLKQPHRITDRLQLLRLRPEYMALLDRETLTPSQAFELSRLELFEQRALFQMICDGRCDTYAKLRAAADGILAASQQASMFELPPAPTAEELATLSKFERMIERLVGLCNEGIRDNEVVVLKKVDPRRAGTIVQQLGIIRTTLGHMEKALQHSAAQGALL
jgi:ParB family chromosome partitioning protein